ncbi:MAG TPA: efflux RND transporter periplasmic adaptor subunit [Candidatus Eisenbacteria bacterium]|nr:efflux RND transporter periplasmic adaptor subunit [Candidatus Eisenbacteria bacterium]
MTRPSPRRARAAARTLVALLAVTLAAGGCKKGAQGGFSMPPMPVETAVVSPRNVADRFEAVGTIEAGEAITVVTEIDASVESLPFREGQPVAQGALLAQMDDETASAELKRAEALRDQSRVTYDRVKSLYDQKAAAPQDLDDADAARKVAEANVQLARERLRKTRITAPFAGLVGAKRVSAGAYLRAGDAITELASLHEIKVTFSAPERYLATLQRGREVSVSTTAYPNYELHGRIDVVSPVLDPATRAAAIIARVRNPGGKFRPGMSASVSVVLSERAKALAVPSEAVFSEGGQTFVYVVKADSTVERTALTLGTRQADVVEVVQGLTDGARIVTAGHQKLFPGAKVIPTDAGAAPGGSAGAPGAAAGAGGAKDAKPEAKEAKPAAKGGEKK